MAGKAWHPTAAGASARPGRGRQESAGRAASLRPPAQRLRPAREAGTLADLPVDREFWEVSALELSARQHVGAVRPLSVALAKLERDRGLRLHESRARVGVGRGHLLDVVLAVPGADAGTPWQEAADDLVSSLIGEQACEDWLQEVHVAPAPRSGPLRLVQPGERSWGMPLSDMVDALEAATRGIVAGLPEQALSRHTRDPEWVLFELKPDLETPRADPLENAQADLVVTTTCAPEMLRCHLTGAPFFSARFSKQGELFCALAIADGDQAQEQRLENRRQLEDAINQQLGATGAAWVVGAGSGLEHSYIDLAIRAGEPIAQPLRSLLSRAGSAPCWLYSFDSAFASRRLPIVEAPAQGPG